MAEGSNLNDSKLIFYYVFIEIWKITGLVSVSLVMNKVAEVFCEKVETYSHRDELESYAHATEKSKKVVQVNEIPETQ